MNKVIFAITPSPALDLSGVVNDLKPNEKSYVHDEIRSPGGNAINAARILTRLKIPVLSTGFLGASTGLEIKNLMDQEGIKNKFVKIKGHSRICVTVSNRADHQQTQLTFSGPSISRSERENLFDLFRSQKRISFLVLGGSLPRGLPVKEILRLMRLAKRQNVESIVDCPANVLGELVTGSPLLIKPNLTEFQEVTRSKVKSIAGVQKEAKKLLEKVTYVCEDGCLSLAFPSQ